MPRKKIAYNYRFKVIIIINYYDDWSIIEFMYEYYSYKNNTYNYSYTSV